MSEGGTLTFTRETFHAGPKLPADADLAKVARERRIEFFLVSYVDIKGVLRSKMVPGSAIGQIQKAGAGFAPFAAWFDYGPEAADLIAKPDPTSLFQVPFQPELAMIMSDCYIKGEKVKQSPRWVLKDQIEKASNKGYVFKTGVEPEFFLLTSDGQPAVSDVKDRANKPCYETQSLMRRYAVLQDIIRTLNACDFGVYQADHEDANGQFEINWHYQDCLTTADQLVFFKWVVKSLSEKHGFRATFMPRPFADLAGNGCHAHCSLWSGSQNVFEASSGYPHDTTAGVQMSQIAWHFLGGVIEKARSYCAITNPTVNSFKRLNGASTNSGATWSPNRVSWSGNNRSHMVRVPDSDRFELRVADGAVNPYMLPAVILAAGLWGMERRKDPGFCFFNPDVNMYAISDGSPELAKVPSLPQNLLDALRILEADRDMFDLLGNDFMTAFLKLKKAEWAEFAAHLTAWELDTTLDC